MNAQSIDQPTIQQLIHRPIKIEAFKTKLTSKQLALGVMLAAGCLKEATKEDPKTSANQLAGRGLESRDTDLGDRRACRCFAARRRGLPASAETESFGTGEESASSHRQSSSPSTLRRFHRRPPRRSRSNHR